MSFLRIFSASALICCLSGSGALAQTTADIRIVQGGENVVWKAAPPMFPSGTRMSFLYGASDKPGPFTMRVMMPAGSTIPPHTHNMDEMLTVLAGSVHHYIGESITANDEKILTAGGFVHLPPNVPHALKAGTQGAIVQVSGTGPFTMTYVNPQDDPQHTNR
ncbi:MULTISPECIES: cupin domain-containing protein [Gluconobacter]|uniref:Cupin n=1 Tax=Gluconobacter cerinus TaxID=38307 RepID=A0A1B6VHI1_9PROT|nr:MULTISPECIES: cupin domain-containing protein [Gluconobacter]MBM3097422.1 cupin domain-containing protein [Gluconobacter cerinus]MBS0983009.1 cupin domain-containing protein [Gluconobacter cerinus]MBS0993165.1 cupin domain-containing protein [Gluconobacter cerinus]MBS1018355.1 cupin domain-containing protein [Gluconobacter cerinus]MBS1021550.1 cupin domain-containing protein [Gluconobacter cerinus]